MSFVRQFSLELKLVFGCFLLRSEVQLWRYSPNSDGLSPRFIAREQFSEDCYPAISSSWSKGPRNDSLENANTYGSDVSSGGSWESLEEKNVYITMSHRPDGEPCGHRDLTSSSRCDRFHCLSCANCKRLQISSTIQRLDIRHILEHDSGFSGLLVRRRRGRFDIDECLRDGAIVDAGCSRGFHSRVLGVSILGIIPERKTMENHGKMTLCDSNP